MSRLHRLASARESLLSAVAVIDQEIIRQTQRKYGEQQTYEQRKARGQCTAAISCKDRPVPGFTMCSKHLRKAAEASARRRVRR